MATSGKKTGSGGCDAARQAHHERFNLLALLS